MDEKWCFSSCLCPDKLQSGMAFSDKAGPEVREAFDEPMTVTHFKVEGPNLGLKSY